MIVPGNEQWVVRDGLAAVETGVPANLQQLIERASPEERRILEIASVVEGEFSATAVAAGVGDEFVPARAHLEQGFALSAERAADAAKVPSP